MLGRFLRVTSLPRAQRFLPSLTSYFARSSASASESTLMAACGWRALMARMAAHPTTSTRRPNQFTATSLPGRVPRDHRGSLDISHFRLPIRNRQRAIHSTLGYARPSGVTRLSRDESSAISMMPQRRRILALLVRSPSWRFSAVALDCDRCMQVADMA